MEREEAIQVVRGLTETTYFDDRELEGLRTLIPELAESEDERVRKGLIYHLKELREWKVGTTLQIKAKEHYDAWIAYLEKQKPVEDHSKRKVYDIMSKLSNLSQSELIPLDSKEFEVINEITTDVHSLLDYPIEQKPIQTEEEREYVKTLKGLVSDFVRDCGGGITDVGYYQRISDWLDGTHIEQKSVELSEEYSSPECGTTTGVWSEEDEKMRLEAIKVLESGCERYIKESGCLPSWHIVITWLKSLRPQPKQEWDEEDEHRRKDAIYFLESAKRHYADTREIEKSIDWLKSLHPQPHWKPSKEQIGALNYAYCELFKREDVGHNILGQLQKLLDDLMNL